MDKKFVGGETRSNDSSKSSLLAADKFNLETTIRKVALKTIDVEKENLLVLRRKLDDVNKAHDYIYQKLSEKLKNLID